MWFRAAAFVASIVATGPTFAEERSCAEAYFALARTSGAVDPIASGMPYSMERLPIVVAQARRTEFTATMRNWWDRTGQTLGKNLEPIATFHSRWGAFDNAKTGEGHWYTAGIAAMPECSDPATVTFFVYDYFVVEGGRTLSPAAFNAHHSASKAPG